MTKGGGLKENVLRLDLGREIDLMSSKVLVLDPLAL